MLDVPLGSSLSWQQILDIPRAAGQSIPERDDLRGRLMRQMIRQPQDPVTLVEFASRSYRLEHPAPADESAELDDVVRSICEVPRNEQTPSSGAMHSDHVLAFLAAIRSSASGVVAQRFGAHMMRRLSDGFDIGSVPRSLTIEDVSRMTWNAPGDFGDHGTALFGFVQSFGDFVISMGHDYLATEQHSRDTSSLLDLMATLTVVYNAGYGPENRWPKLPGLPPETDDLNLIAFQWIDAARTAGSHMLGAIAASGPDSLAAGQRLIVHNSHVFSLLAAHGTRGLNVNSSKGARIGSVGAEWQPPVHLFQITTSPDGDIPVLDLAADTPYARLRERGTQGSCPAFDKLSDSELPSIEVLTTIAPLFITPLVESVRDFYRPMGAISN